MLYHHIICFHMNSHEESYDYYYGPRQGEGSGARLRGKRIAPPPPPGFDDSPRVRRRQGGIFCNIMN